MPLTLVTQRISDTPDLPSDVQLTAWAERALSEGSPERAQNQALELCIRIVGNEEITELNTTYRGKTGPTNVLSFPADHSLPDFISPRPLGDIVIAAPVIKDEANRQEKQLHHHWAHMVVHGVLHLLGMDHINEDEAEAMEALEIDVLSAFGISNPYA